jgi:cyclic-di-AMP phosphodiesterase PgpH
MVRASCLSKLHQELRRLGAWLPRQPLAQPRKAQPPVVTGLAILSLTGLMGQRFYNQPELAIGRQSPMKITAPETARVEDVKTTEEKRQAARIGAVAALRRDGSIDQQIGQDLRDYLDRANQLRDRLLPPPIISIDLLPLHSQWELLDCPEADWRPWHDAMVARRSAPVLPKPEETADRPPIDRHLKATELLLQRQPNPRRQEILKQLDRAHSAYQQAKQRLADPAIERLVREAPQPDRPPDRPWPLTKEPLFQADILQIDAIAWSKTQTALPRILELMLRQGLPSGLPEDALVETIGLHSDILVPSSAVPFSRRLLHRILRPNLVADVAQSQRLGVQAAQAVEPIYVEIQKGQTIVRPGQTISPSAFVLLDHFNRSKRSPDWEGWAIFGGAVALSVGSFGWIIARWGPRLRRRDRIVVLILSLGTPLWLLLKIPTNPLPAVGLLLGSFYGPVVGGVTIALVGAGLVTGLEIQASWLFSAWIGAAIAAILASRLRSREELALLGLIVGLSQGLVQLIVSLILSPAAVPLWWGLLQGAMIQAIEGIAWCIVALGVSPYLERLFDLLTPTRLAELSNLNRPLLRRLAAEAPGTFQHTLFVATLAEAAAYALGCNAELVRAGTLYHDIGKLHDPQGFIENQMGEINKHDLIDNPWKSAALIKKHVSEGVIMARRASLPKLVQAFVPEHQGTMDITYFRHKAQQLHQSDPDRYPLIDAEFRYDGPAPQSRETGLVMLADSCEAALRSLKDASVEDALGMVNKILRARWQDQQLASSGLSRSDLDIIASVFVQIWQQHHHKRIAYPASRPLPGSPYPAPSYPSSPYPNTGYKP